MAKENKGKEEKVKPVKNDSEKKPNQSKEKKLVEVKKAKQGKEVSEEKEVQQSVDAKFDPYEIIKYPLSTEKSIRQTEFDNKLVFAVHPRATKKDVKQAIEELFKVRVVKVNVQNSFQGQKRAYVKLGPESLASDVSADLGLI